MDMTLKGLIDEDFVNYRVPSMTLCFPHCDFKCNAECGEPVCQNAKLIASKNISVDIDSLIRRYLTNEITSAIVMQGLEPFMSFDELYEFISRLREVYKCSDDIVIYTGYYPDEILDKTIELQCFNNIVIKFGRFIPGYESHYDDVLGVELASDNQYAERIS